MNDLNKGHKQLLISNDNFALENILSAIIQILSR